jgi:hypothetical protein
MTMNGNTPNLRLSFHQNQCVEVLREALAEAEQGKVDGVAIVLCMPGGWAPLFGGSRPGDLNLGLDQLKRDILDNVTGAKVKPEGKTSILRVR